LGKFHRFFDEDVRPAIEDYELAPVDAVHNAGINNENLPLLIGR